MSLWSSTEILRAVSSLIARADLLCLSPEPAPRVSRFRGYWDLRHLSKWRNGTDDTIKGSIRFHRKGYVNGDGLTDASRNYPHTPSPPCNPALFHKSTMRP